ncbi:MAG: hypothetical protein QOI85_1084 [Chloroflexota bacterium]|nr:hypothetical protein [Chloroflexota bacterium]
MRAALAAIGIAVLVPTATPVPLSASSENIIGVDLAALPRSGAAYERVRALAAQTAMLDLADNTGPGNDVLLAKAIMGDKDGVLAMIREARIRDAAEGMVPMGPARNLGAWAIALNLVDAHEEDDWLREARDRPFLFFGWLTTPGLVYPGLAVRANNHGSASDMSLIAIDAHLGDLAHLESQVIPVMRQRLGDDMGIELRFGNSVQADPADPVVVGRPGTTALGVDLDGLLLEEQRREGAFPNCGNYNYGASGQFLVSARILGVLGYPVATWGQGAIRRIFVALKRLGCSPQGDDAWQGSMVSAMFGTGLVPATIGDGKSFCCTDYLFPSSGPSAPIAGIQATPMSGVAPLPVSFTDSSTNDPSSWAWTFGDGGTSAEQHPTHTYADVGSYTVGLTVTNAQGSDATTTTISATEVPVVLDNHPPICDSIGLSAVADRPGIEVAPSCTDADLGDVLSYQIADPAGFGTASVTPDGNLLYVPAPGQTGSDSFTYTASDGTATSAVATVSVMITSNATPACDPVDLEVVDGRADGEVAPECSDANVADQLTYLIDSPASSGTASVTAAGKLHYERDVGATGGDTFTYVATDASGAVSEPAAVTVSITPNAAPECAPLGLTVVDGRPGRTIAPSCTDTNLGDVLTYAIVDQGLFGVASVTGVAPNPYGLRYTPNPGASGTDTFTYLATDASGATGQPAIVTVTILPNTPPECDPLSLTAVRNGPRVQVTQSCLDGDGDVLTYAIATAPTKGSASVVAGNLRYVPSAGQAGTDSFTYTASDGIAISTPATVSVTITNATPSCSARSLSASVNGPGVEVAPSCTDANGDPLTYLIDAAPGSGTATITPAGKLRYVPAAGASGTDSFTYTAFDGIATSPPAMVSVTISNASPSCSPRSLTAVHNGPAVEVAPSCSDPNGDVLTYAIADDPTKGTASVVAGMLRYVPAAGQAGTDSFTYTASDGTATSAPATVSVTIANATPTCSPRSLTAVQDGVAVEVPPSCTDANLGDVLTYAIATGPTKGSASVVAGKLRYVPTAGQAGTDSFTYTASDGIATSAPATVSVTITPISVPSATFVPVADTFVSSAAPTANNGAATTLNSRGNGTQINSYLRFTVSGLSSASHTVLRLWVSDASPDAGKLYRVANNTWAENLRYANRPALGPLIIDLGAVSAGAWREIDVSSYVTGNGTYSFAVIGENSDITKFHSREGVNDPQLVVTP